MGQAKRRGSFEMRRTQAVAKQGEFVRAMGEPVDVETFKFAFVVWMNAGAMRMSAPNPDQVQIEDTEGGVTYRLANIPLNRAGLAVTEQLREAGVHHPQAYLARLMHLSQLYDEKDGLLAPFFKADAHGEVMISSSLVEAMATGRFIVRPEHHEDGSFMGFDIEDVAAKASALDAGQAT